MQSNNALRRFQPWANAVTLALVASGCGGDGDSTSPDGSFPPVEGRYSISGSFDGLTRDQASFVGALSLAQASSRTGAVTGTVDITITAEGRVTSSGNVPLQAASVEEDGSISFSLGSVANGAVWTFTGTAAGETITGRHDLTGQSGSFSGDWTATTGAAGTGSLTVTTSSSGPSLDPDGYTLSLDAAVRDTLAPSDQVTFERLAPGNHTLGLSLVASNCQVQGDNPRLVVISSGESAAATFEVVCS